MCHPFICHSFTCVTHLLLLERARVCGCACESEGERVGGKEGRERGEGERDTRSEDMKAQMDQGGLCPVTIRLPSHSYLFLK